MNEITNLNKNPHDEIQMAHKVGRLEGRLDGFESRFNHFEDRIEARLTNIENAIKEFTNVYMKGRGIKIAVGALLSFIVVIPSLYQFYLLLKSFFS